MKNEIEATFSDINIADMKSKLISVGATMVLPERIMRRVVIDYPDKRLQNMGKSWVRIRDEGNKVTLTYKETVEHDLASIKEIEVGVSDYKKIIEIMLAIGLVIHADQETKRETWRLNNTEIVIDQWPWLPPQIEIEGKTESNIKWLLKN